MTRRLAIDRIRICPACGQPWHEWRGSSHVPPGISWPSPSPRTRRTVAFEDDRPTRERLRAEADDAYTVTLAEYGPVTIEAPQLRGTEPIEPMVVRFDLRPELYFDQVCAQPQPTQSTE